MSGITLQWLRSELMIDGTRREGILRAADAAPSLEDLMTDAAISETVILAVMILAAILLVICLVLLLVRLLGSRRKHKAAPAGQVPMDAGSITQELPVAAVQAALCPLKILTDIVYCESEEIIP